MQPADTDTDTLHKTKSHRIRLLKRHWLIMGTKPMWLVIMMWILILWELPLEWLVAMQMF